MDIELLTQYYGVDYLAMFLTFIAIYLVGSKKRYGFMIGLVGNSLWMLYSVWAVAPAIFIVNLVLGILYLRGYIKWGDDKLDK